MSYQNLVGEILGQYELLDLLGAGGMGAVYRAYQANLKRYVAVKVLPLTLVEQPGYLERFAREAQTAAALEHPNIIPIYDFGTQGKISYIAMPLLGGGSVTDRLALRLDNRKPLPSPREVARVIKPLADALDYAHRQGVIHRDIKTSNVMFDQHGTPILADFGIAALTGGSTALTASGIIGTPSYMAPELWRGEILRAADQYALAVLVYTVLAGAPPFKADNPFSLMNKHLNDSPPPLSLWREGVPETTMRVLEKALAKDAEQRYPTVTAFAQAFEEAAEEYTGPDTGFLDPLPKLPQRSGSRTSTTNSRTPRARRTVYRNPVVWAVSLIILLGISAGVLLVASFTDREAQLAARLTAAAEAPATSPPIVLLITATPTSSPEPTPAPQASATPAVTMTPFPTQAAPAATETATRVPLAMPSSTLLSSPTPTETRTPTSTPSSTPSPSPSAMPTSTSTATPSPTPTPVPTDTPSPTPSPSATATTTSTATPTATPTASDSPTPTPTLLPTATPLPLPAGFPGNPVTRNEDWQPMMIVFDGVAMVLVPVGCFSMGENGDGGTQCFAYPFWIDQYEVSNRQYGSSGRFTSADQPRENVSWFDAAAFCEQRNARLPGEAEWEYAARGPDNLVYPTGDEFPLASVLFAGTYQGNGTWAIDRGNASWIGAWNLSGNVQEWVNSLLRPYPYNQGDGRETNRETTPARVVRGGSWGDTMQGQKLTGWNRFSADPDSVDNYTGFRCARDWQPADVTRIANVAVEGVEIAALYQLLTPTSTLTPTPSLTPSASPTVTETPTITNTPTVTPTFAPAVQVASVDRLDLGVESGGGGRLASVQLIRPFSLQDARRNDSIWDNLDFQDSRTPATVTYRRSVDPIRRYRWGFSWCGMSAENFREALEPLTVAFYVNGVPLDGSALLVADEVVNREYCRLWVTVITGWSSLPAVLEVRYHLNTSVTTGTASYAPGDYVQRIEVASSSAQEAQSAPVVAEVSAGDQLRLTGMSAEIWVRASPSSDEGSFTAIAAGTPIRVRDTEPAFDGAQWWREVDVLDGSGRVALAGWVEEFQLLFSMGVIPQTGEAQVDARVWSLPDAQRGEAIDTLEPGTRVLIVGGPVRGAVQLDSDDRGVWYQVKLPNDTDVLGWVWAEQLALMYPVTCDSSLQSRLIPGLRGQVTPGDPNRMRNAPALDGDQISSISPGDPLIVLEGPICNDGFAWWRVYDNGLVGWTVESGSGVYYVQPINTTDGIRDVSAEADMEAAYQPFEQGEMYALVSLRRIFMVYTNADGQPVWRLLRDRFREGDREFDPNIEAPPGLLQPVRGFGRAWRDSDDAQSIMGWATAPEVGYNARYEYHFEGALDEYGWFQYEEGYYLISRPDGSAIYLEEDGSWAYR